MITLRPILSADSELGLRREVRDFTATWSGLMRKHANGDGPGMAYTRALADAGFVGMGLPTKYGGTGRTAVDRWVVTEELCAMGAPLGGQWVADRQTAPLILRFGSEELRDRLLPAIARGACWFCIGMSEPDAGSDLASVRTRAEPVDGGWLVNGAKLWTSGAQQSHFMLALCRTSGAYGDRHRGLSQLIIDMASPGVSVRPVTYLDGRTPYNEVVLTDVFVPDWMLLGRPGDGWQQVTSELAYERSGPERYMEVIPLLESALQNRRFAFGSSVRELGELIARLVTIRQMSRAVMSMIDEGRSPALEAALVKSVATRFKRDVVNFVRRTTRDQLLHSEHQTSFESQLTHSIFRKPAFTIAGGSTEVLRGIVAKEMVR